MTRRFFIGGISAAAGVVACPKFLQAGAARAGDFADWARYEQIKRLGACWDKVFPGDKAPDGRHVEKLFIYGNHCMTPWTWGKDFKGKKGGKITSDITLISA